MARSETDAEGQKQYAALRQRLRDLGWRLGQSLQIDVRWVFGDPQRSLTTARELATLKPDVIVANGTPSLAALRQVTSTIPIVFVAVADPVGQHFVPSLSRPDGNITGFSAEEHSMGGKWLSYLKEIAPAVSQVAVVFNPETAPYAPMFMPTMEAGAKAMGVSLAIRHVRNPADIEGVFMATASQSGAGVIVIPDSFTFGQRANLIASAAQHRMPAIYPIGIMAPAGGLIAYGIDRVDMFHRAGSYVDRLLKGAAPAELPVQQPTKFELVINMKTAKALGLTVPQSLLLSADEVIE
jgi:putative ABC transport system substrate-binding protein